MYQYYNCEHSGAEHNFYGKPQSYRVDGVLYEDIYVCKECSAAYHFQGINPARILGGNNAAFEVNKLSKILQRKKYVKEAAESKLSKQDKEFREQIERSVITSTPHKKFGATPWRMS